MKFTKGSITVACDNLEAINYHASQTTSISSLPLITKFKRIIYNGTVDSSKDNKMTI